MQILTIETESLGDRSYVIHDGNLAAVIDPQRDIDRVLDLLAVNELELTAVFETHVHNDYVTGGLELARRTGADYHLAAGEELDFDAIRVSDGDEIKVGTFLIRVMHTPGHTPRHLSYVANDAVRDIAVFTGGSLLFGSVGRTDLVATELTEELTRSQHRSARRIAGELADDVEVLPTHGFGSFCSSGETTGSERSTVGTERRDNQALTVEDEDEFVRVLVAGLDAYPAYYAHMGPANRHGAVGVDLSPAPSVDTDELLRRIGAGEWVVDLRQRKAFARDHVRGTINIELADNASTYLGWLIAWGTPVTLLAESQDQIAQMQRQLVRIGIDRPAGQVADGLAAIEPSAERGHYEITDFTALQDALTQRHDVIVLDTRLDLEWAGGHLPMAVHIPLHELEQRASELPEGQIWVHCASGYRSSIAASLLARAGRDVVMVDDDFETNARRQFDVTSPAG